MDFEDQFGAFTRRDWQEADEGTVRFAMIALGWWTRERAMPAVENSRFCETTVVVSGSREKAERVAANNETVEHALTYEEFHDGAASEAYDAVYICTPNALHLPYVETAADLGKAILCEKPMEADVERAEDLVAAAGDATLMIAYRMHTEPAVRRARDLIREGVIGDPVQVHGNMTQEVLELIPDPDQWRLDADLVGYGTSVMDIGIYPLNTTRFLLEEDPVRVQAATASLGEGFEDVPDERAAFTLEFPGTVHATCTASQNAYQGSHLRVTGTEGRITLEPIFFPWAERGMRVSRDGNTVEYEWEQIDQMEEEFDYFADCVLTGRDPYPDGEHGLVDMRTIRAVYEAADEERPVAVE